MKKEDTASKLLIKSSIYYFILVIISISIFYGLSFYNFFQYDQTLLNDFYYDAIIFRFIAFLLFILFFSIIYPFFSSYFLYKLNIYKKTLPKKTNTKLSLIYLLNFLVFITSLLLYLNQNFIIAYILSHILGIFLLLFTLKISIDLLK